MFSNDALGFQYCMNVWCTANYPLCVCSTSLMKTLYEKDKLPIMSIFFFSKSVFYLFGELSAIFIQFEILVCKLFQFESQICSLGQEFKKVGQFQITCTKHTTITL